MVKTFTTECHAITVTFMRLEKIYEIRSKRYMKFDQKDMKFDQKDMKFDQKDRKEFIQVISTCQSEVIKH